MVHRNFSRSFYVFLLAILCVSSVDAVDTLQVTTPDRLYEDWRWTEFDRKSGLAGKTVGWVYEDRDENIWFATTGGAQKYDGLRWTTYTTEDGLAHNLVASINQTKDGAIWIGTGMYSDAPNQSIGMTRLVEASDGGRAEVKADTFDGWSWINGFLEAADGSIWINLSGDTPDQSNNIRRYVNGAWQTVDQPMQTRGQIVQDREGAIWTGTRNGITLRFDGVRWTQFPLSSDTTRNGSNFNRVSLDASGTVWVAHDEGHSRFRNGVWERLPIPLGPKNHTKDGITWIGGIDGTDSNLTRYQNGQLEPHSFDRMRNSSGLVFPHQARDGALWLTTRDGSKAYRVDMTSGIQVYTGADTLRTGPEGRDGSVWFYTPTQAVHLVNDVWLGYGKADGFLDGTVVGMDRSADGAIWAIGTHKGQGAAALYRSGRWQVFTEADGVIDDPTSLMPTREGSLWVMGTHGGKGAVCHFGLGDGGEAQWQRVTSVFQGWRVRTSYEASDGTLWFGDQLAEDNANQGTGLYRYDPAEQTWMNFGEADGFVASNPRRGTQDGLISGLAEWPTGTLWVGAAWGMYRIDLAGLPEKRTFFQRSADAFEIDMPKFRNLTPTADALWFHPLYPRDGGAVRYDGETWQVFKEENGLPDDGIMGIFRTSDGGVWFQGMQGLSRFKALPDRPDEGWTRFQDTGLRLSSEASRNFTETRDGSFWINTDTGVARVRNLKIQDPETFLDPAPQSVSSEGDILLEFSGRAKWDTTPAEDLMYNWRLNGGEWTTTRDAIVSLAGLRAGSHTFEVRTLAPNLNTDPTPALHAFVVAFPWWRNPFVAGPGLMLIFAVLFQSARVVRGKRRLEAANLAMSDANKELFQVNVDLQREQVLERLRGQAQGMQSSEDIKPVVEAVYRELKGLGLPLIVTTINIIISDTEKEVWSTAEDGSALEPVIVKRPPLKNPGREARQRGEDYYHTHLGSKVVKVAINEAIAIGDPRWKGVPEERWPQEGYLYQIFYDGGTVGVGSEEPIAEDYLMLIKRFGEVFRYAHSRHKELQEKEAQNRRLTVEASVQRLRAEVSRWVKRQTLNTSCRF